MAKERKEEDGRTGEGEGEVRQKKRKIREKRQEKGGRNDARKRGKVKR